MGIGKTVEQNQLLSVDRESLISSLSRGLSLKLEMLPLFISSLFCRLLMIPSRGETTINLSAFPTGTCALCCSIDPDRDIEYQLHTRKNPRKSHLLQYKNQSSLQSSPFNPLNPTIVYIHGYAERASGESATVIRNAYLKRAPYNVILVDWSKLAALPWYITAVRNARLVGTHVAKMVSWLETQNAIPLSQLHVIGFSLGAEVAGFMGKALAPRKVGRITGLDAAYPLYMNTGQDGHLAASDASFVDVIHTDGGIFGFPSPIGHADFYPNGGRPLQPGCGASNLFVRGMFRLFRHYIVCSHNRAWRFYAESVSNPRGFPATRCRRWRPDVRSCTWIPESLMGFAANRTSRGIFYLRTNSKFPFARNYTDFNF